jgi:hypothetical protein
MLHPGLRAALVFGLSVVPAIGAACAQGRIPPPLTDHQLIVKFHELTRSKGDYLKSGLGPDFCRRLGVRPIGYCEVFAARFLVDDRPTAAFYSLDDGRNGMVRLFITSLLEPSYRDDYNVDVDGRLQRAVRRRGDASSRVSVIDATAGFKRVMDFLRTRQDELAGWPDAAIVDDGSCPKGQVKRVPRDPRNAVCLNRARLKLP